MYGDTMRHAWNEVLKEVKEKIPQTYFEPFISSLSVECFDDSKLIIKAPSLTIRNHVEKKYQHFLEEAAEKVTGHSIRLEFSTIDSDVIVEPPSQIDEDDFTFNHDYSFDTFVVGDTNRLAYFASIECVEKPGIINPLFLYGKVGVGKTHLLHSIGSKLLEVYPNRSVKYISISNFLSEFVSNVQNRNTMDAFRKRYCSFDTLLVDDIQYLHSGAEKTQEEFFAIFNYLFDRKKQIVIASDRASHELTLQERLKSRLETGNQVNIASPNYDVRTRIIEVKSRLMNLNLDTASINYICDNFATDTRGLLGSLNDIFLYKKTFSLLFVTIDTVKQVLERRLLGYNKETNPSEKVLSLVCSQFSISYQDIVSKSRKAELILPRHLSMYILNQKLKMNKTIVGRLFNTKHTTVINAVNKIKKLLETDMSFQTKYKQICSRLDLL
jgi:chromosomal replication initiator protein